MLKQNTHLDFSVDWPASIWLYMLVTSPQERTKIHFTVRNIWNKITRNGLCINRENYCIYNGHFSNKETTVHLSLLMAKLNCQCILIPLCDDLKYFYHLYYTPKWNPRHRCMIQWKQNCIWCFSSESSRLPTCLYIVSKGRKECSLFPFGFILHTRSHHCRRCKGRSLLHGVPVCEINVRLTIWHIFTKHRK